MNYQYKKVLQNHLIMYCYIRKNVYNSATYYFRSFTSKNIQLDNNIKLFYIDSVSKLILISTFYININIISKLTLKIYIKKRKF